MKKLRTIGILLIVVLCVSMFVGCKPKYEASFMSGEEVIETVKTAEGELLEPIEASQEGKVFIGWFATPRLSHRFDFTAPITEDVSVFGGFAEFSVDDRNFFVVGSGTSPALLHSNWGNGKNVSLEKTSDTTKNEYKITMDLYEGEQFQFAINGKWETKRGFGYLTKTGENGIENFTSDGGIGETASKGKNIKCDVEGNYTFTLTTYPDEDYYDETMAGYTESSRESYKHSNVDSIDWVRNGDIIEEKPEAYNAYYIKGSEVTNWGDRFTKDLVMAKDGDTFTFKKYLAVGENFLFTSQTVLAGKEIGVGKDFIKNDAITATDTETLKVLEQKQGGNFEAKVTGEYTFIFNEKTKTLTASCDQSVKLPTRDVYLRGNMGAYTWEDMFEANYKLSPTATANEVVIASVALAEGDEFSVTTCKADATAIGSWGEPDYSILDGYNYQYVGKVVDAGDNANANADFAAANPTGEYPNYNILAKADGTYKVSYNAYSNEINFYRVN